MLRSRGRCSNGRTVPGNSRFSRSSDDQAAVPLRKLRSQPNQQRRLCSSSHHSKGRLAAPASLLWGIGVVRCMTEPVRSPGRILALNLRRQRFGYAVMEGASFLLDWGVRRRLRRNESKPRFFVRSLESLLYLWRPSLVVFMGVAKSMNGCTTNYMLQISREMRRHRIRTRRFSIRDVQRVFGMGAPLTQQSMAEAMVQQLPFFAANLPPTRKPWMSEDYRMLMFSAIALALAAGRLCLNHSIPEESGSIRKRKFVIETQAFHYTCGRSGSISDGSGMCRTKPISHRKLG